MVAPLYVEVVVLHEGVDDAFCSWTAVPHVAEDVELVYGESLYDLA